MSAREILLSDLVGRQVHDADGRSIGRIQELYAEIELHDHGNDYVVREFHVGAFGAFEALAGSRFAQQVMARLGRLTGHRALSISWELMDLSDPTRPRATKTLSELARSSSAP